MKTFNIYGKLGDNGEIKRLAYRIPEKDAIRVANEFHHNGYVSVIMLTQSEPGNRRKEKGK